MESGKVGQGSWEVRVTAFGMLRRGVMRDDHMGGMGKLKALTRIPC